VAPWQLYDVPSNTKNRPTADFSAASQISQLITAAP
jgi:hypothetical protein